jgi:hypothetical protein
MRALSLMIQPANFRSELPEARHVLASNQTNIVETHGMCDEMGNGFERLTVDFGMDSQ